MTDTRVVSSKSGSSRQSLIPSTDVIQLDVGLSVGTSVTSYRTTRPLTRLQLYRL